MLQFVSSLLLCAVTYVMLCDVCVGVTAWNVLLFAVFKHACYCFFSLHHPPLYRYWFDLVWCETVYDAQACCFITSVYHFFMSESHRCCIAVFVCHLICFVFVFALAAHPIEEHTAHHDMLALQPPVTVESYRTQLSSCDGADVAIGTTHTTIPMQSVQRTPSAQLQTVTSARISPIQDSTPVPPANGSSQGTNSGSLCKKSSASDDAHLSSASAARPGTAFASDDVRGRSLCMFSARNKLRILFARLVTSKTFDNIILGTIVLSSVLLATDNPLSDPDSFIVALISVMDIVFTVVFAVEMLMKVIAQGLLFGA